MPEDLLLGLETSAPVAEGLENIEDLVRVLVRQTRGVVESLKGSAREFATIWQGIVVDVAEGKTAQMQADRPKTLSAFEKRLGQLKHIHDLIASLTALGRADLPGPDVLTPEIEGMERLKVRVFDRWQSAEDLEKLAVEHYPLSQSRLQKIAAAHTPPASWYEGEEEQLLQE